ncbi:gliding motility-associated lipoprotein GldB [Tenacibaculum sp. MAR_2009_124]|uniref:gliding motility lipoprotein GldB n=1 Tax=Tenacibaculum sp. MAR_2009_124 TaxID=1250059 RepID=UPI0008963C34|nr:gliding motility lipoprotein GldB [Tenacibaculum sp. MAR_2009_124]SED14408.1 gliding motility-associated lipoprotein GldB [Tenacibaculum sp. MAR_2009_124]
MRKIIALFLAIILMSCEKESKPEIDVSEVKVSFNIDRFDKDFYQSEKSLEELKSSYSFLFPRYVHDSIWESRRTNLDEQELFEETQKLYNEVNELEEQLKMLFKHVKYYNPKFKSPEVITMLTNIDYESRVVYSDTLLFVSLDAYLGKNHKFYGDYPAYVKQNNTKQHIVVDVASKIVSEQVFPKTNRTFIDKMIYKGKKMYLKDVYLGKLSDHVKIGYSKEKSLWAKENEEEVWRYFIEKDLLFSTDKSLDKRFLDMAPFSKFYLGQDNLSPGRIGEFIGWQIVKSYMKNNDVSLHELIRTSEEEIFTKSKYKPRR